MKVNFDFSFKDLNGMEIENAFGRIVISNSLLSPEFREGDDIQKYELACKLNKGEAEISDSEFNLLRQLLDDKNKKLFSPLARAQLLIYMNSIS